MQYDVDKSFADKLQLIISNGEKSAVIRGIIK